MSEKIKIVLITSGQPALNPRLVKEADALASHGFEVKVIYQYWNKWATSQDAKLLKLKTWSHKRVGGSPRDQRLIYWYSRLRFKLLNALYRRSQNSYFLAEQTLGRCTSLLTKEALKNKAHLYIAHNLSALPAANKAAKKFGNKYGFDAEDFHRSELKNDPNRLDYKRKKLVEDKYLPYSSYLTTSSPSIQRLYGGLYHMLDPICILNAFPIQNPSRKTLNDKYLDLVWFSQTIGKDRGIENIIAALTVSDYVRLHLLGKISDNTKTYFNHICEELDVSSERIYYYDPIAPDSIVSFCAQFDVGVAAEPGFSINNDAALSNKLFTYLQAGLAVIASDTSAQKKFLQEHPQIGYVYYKDDPSSLKSILENYLAKPDLLYQNQTEARKLALSKMNWETEKGKFILLITKILSLAK